MLVLGGALLVSLFASLSPLLGADMPVSFGAGAAGVFDWARDGVDGAAATINPARIRAPHRVRVFMFASKTNLAGDDSKDGFRAGTSGILCREQSGKSAAARSSASYREAAL
jgi:hypothetical protein